MAEKRAAEQARREKAREQYEEDVTDWYNRRDMEGDDRGDGGKS